LVHRSVPSSRQISEPGSESVFTRVKNLFEQGGLPDWTDFDSINAVNAKLVNRWSPDSLDPALLISLDQGDSVIGPVLRAGFFVTPYTSAAGQSDLLEMSKGTFRGDTIMSPFVQKPDRNSILSTVESKLFSQFCRTELLFRKVTQSNGERILIGAVINMDGRAVCQMDFEGVPVTKVRTLAYAKLP
jgi:hypothetical protein